MYLTICTSCQQYEGALTTHCPQELYDEKAEDVYEGLLDFRFGNWVKGTKNRVTAGKLSNQIANEPLFLEILKNDETPPLQFIKEQQDYITSLKNKEKEMLLKDYL